METLKQVLTSEFGAGLIGAVVGGAASLLGAQVQSRSANKTSRETLAKASAQSAYEALGAIQELMAGKSFVGTGTSEARDEWNRERTVLVIRAKGAANLLPKSQERRRTQVRKAMNLIKDWDGLTRWSDHEAATRILVSEARKQLGTFIQGEKEPEVRDIATVVHRELSRLRRERMIDRLKELEREGEESGLDDPEDIAEANQLKTELGVRHSSELS